MRYLTVKAASEMTSLSPSYLYRLIGERKLTSTKIGRATRISETALIDFMEKGSREKI